MELVPIGHLMLFFFFLAFLNQFRIVHLDRLERFLSVDKVSNIGGHAARNPH